MSSRFCVARSLFSHASFTVSLSLSLFLSLPSAWHISYVTVPRLSSTVLGIALAICGRSREASSHRRHAPHVQPARFARNDRVYSPFHSLWRTWDQLLRINTLQRVIRRCCDLCYPISRRELRQVSWSHGQARVYVVVTPLLWRHNTPRWLVDVEHRSRRILPVIRVNLSPRFSRRVCFNPRILNLIC